jgi:guanylate kinase
MEFQGKALIISAPSGAGKTTLVKQLLTAGLPLGFSVSAASRAMRPGEVDGQDYYFLTPDQFRNKIAAGDFLEWEEVYADQFYGTLKSEVERIWKKKLHLIFDVDVKGGMSIKKYFAAKSLSVFILPSSFETLVKRLETRGTENAESLKKRISRAEYEMSFADQFDKKIVNDNLEVAGKELLQVVQEFLEV